MARIGEEARAGMAANRKNWDSRVSVHLGPNGYDLDRLVEDPDPMINVFSDDVTPEHMIIDFPYFDGTPGMRFEYSSSYAGTGEVTSPVTYEWAHDIGSVVQSLSYTITAHKPG